MYIKKKKIAAAPTTTATTTQQQPKKKMKHSASFPSPFPRYRPTTSSPSSYHSIRPRSTRLNLKMMAINPPTHTHAHPVPLSTTLQTKGDTHTQRERERERERKRGEKPPPTPRCYHHVTTQVARCSSGREGGMEEGGGSLELVTHNNPPVLYSPPVYSTFPIFTFPLLLGFYFPRYSINNVIYEPEESRIGRNNKRALICKTPGSMLLPFFLLFLLLLPRQSY